MYMTTIMPPLKHKTASALAGIILAVTATGCFQTATDEYIRVDRKPTVAANGTSYNYIPIVLVLYQNSSYGSAKRYLVEDVANFATDIGFNDHASSAIVYK